MRFPKDKETPASSAAIYVERGEPTVYFNSSSWPESFRRFYQTGMRRKEAEQEHEEVLADDRDLANAAPQKEEVAPEKSAAETVRHRYMDYELDTEGKPIHLKKRELQKWSVNRAGKFSFGRVAGVRTCTLETHPSSQYPHVHEATKESVIAERKRMVEKGYYNKEDTGTFEEIEVVTCQHHLDPQFTSSLSALYKI